MPYKPAKSQKHHISVPLNPNLEKTKTIKKVAGQLMLLFRLKNIRKRIAYSSIILVSFWLIFSSLVGTKSSKIESYILNSLHILLGISTSALVTSYFLEEYIVAKNNLDVSDN